MFANTLLFDAAGEYAGFDDSEPTSKDFGKSSVVEMIKSVYGYALVTMIGAIIVLLSYNGIQEMVSLMRRPGLPLTHLSVMEEMSCAKIPKQWLIYTLMILRCGFICARVNKFYVCSDITGCAKWAGVTELRWHLSYNCPKRRLRTWLFNRCSILLVVVKLLCYFSML